MNIFWFLASVISGVAVNFLITLVILFRIFGEDE